MLNQTEIGANKNKFYVIQVLKSDSGNTFYCFNVWGRVGENGARARQPGTANRVLTLPGLNRSAEGLRTLRCGLAGHRRL